MKTFCRVWNALYAPLQDEHFNVCCSYLSSICMAQSIIRIQELMECRNTTDESFHAQKGSVDLIEK